MIGDKRAPFWLQALFLVFVLWTAVCLAQEAAAKPRFLGLPWVVIDRSSNVSPTVPPPPRGSASSETERLAYSAQAAVDAVVHRHGVMEMIPRKEWQPKWKQLQAETVLRPAAGCGWCSPAADLLWYDRAVLQRLGQAVSADYIWLGVTVVPLSGESSNKPCAPGCPEALKQQREPLLARSASVLFRVRDGAIVWYGGARRLDREVLRQSQRLIHPPAAEPSSRPHPPRRGPWGSPHDRQQPSLWIIYSPPERREMAVDDTAHMLANAFVRVHERALRGEGNASSSSLPRLGTGSMHLPFTQ